MRRLNACDVEHGWPPTANIHMPTLTPAAYADDTAADGDPDGDSDGDEEGEEEEEAGAGSTRLTIKQPRLPWPKE